MKGRERKYILVARYENVFAGLRHWGVMFRDRAVVGEVGKATRPGQVILAYGRMGSDSSGEP